MSALAANRRLWTLPQRRTAHGIVYRELGAGRPLLLVHGGSGSWLHWWRNIEPLAERHRVIAVDLPGYGDSVDVPEDITLDAYIELVRSAALEAMGDEPLIDIVAFSFGGLIGAGVAARLSARARRALLFAPSGFQRPTGRELATRSRSAFPKGDEGAREYLRHNLVAMMLHDSASADDEAIEIHRWNLMHARFPNLEFSFSNRLPEFLAEIRCPLMVAYGEHDRTPYPSREARLEICREAAPGLAHEVIPAAGHWLQFEQPTATNAVIEKFLS